MSDDPAMGVVRGCYEALAKRDLPGFLALLSPDCVMYETGGGQIPHAGVYAGRGEMAAVFQRLSELTGGSGSFELQNLFSDGEGGVVSIHRNTGRRLDGRVLDCHEALLFAVVDGLVSSVRNYYRDTAEVAAFWRD
jgi:ketosteroid isomerase-like protein